MPNDSIHVNIYADEIQLKYCPLTNTEWNYIGLIIENLQNPLLDDIIRERFINNFDQQSIYFNRNNRKVHWNEIKSADTKNICDRWLKYIMNPNKSKSSFYSYILGLNATFLNKEEFDIENLFNCQYNRFFRSAVSYALKKFFNNKRIIVDNIYHEVGQQYHHDYFPWHTIARLEEDERNISFNCQKIQFLPKDHRSDQRSNLIQLCDTILGVSTSIIHGIEKSNTSKYRESLADLYLPLFKRIINNPSNQNSKYEYYNRIMISFFPKYNTTKDDTKRKMNQFYTKRTLYYEEQKTGQLRLDL